MLSEVLFLVMVYLTFKHGVKWVLKIFGLLLVIIFILMLSMGPLASLFLIPIFSRIVTFFLFGIFSGWLFRFIVSKAK